MKINSKVKIGVLAVLTIAVLFWGINFLKGNDIFSNVNKYYINYENIQGLSLSSAVYVRGLKVGQVKEISLNNENYDNILVQITVEDKIKIPKGTIARIFSSDLMGTKSIELRMGKSFSMLENGDFLIPEIEESLGNQVKLQMVPLKMKAENLMGSFDSALVVIRSVFSDNTKEDFRKSISGIKLTFDNLQRLSKTLDTLFSGDDIQHIFTNAESITDNIAKNNASIKQIINNLDQITDSIAKSNVVKTINNAATSLEMLNSILDKVNKGEGSLGLLVNNDSLYNNLENASRDLDILIKDLNENPKKYVHFSIIDFSKDTKKKDKNKDN